MSKCQNCGNVVLNPKTTAEDILELMQLPSVAEKWKEKAQDAADEDPDMIALIQRASDVAYQKLIKDERMKAACLLRACLRMSLEGTHINFSSTFNHLVESKEAMALLGGVPYLQEIFDMATNHYTLRGLG